MRSVRSSTTPAGWRRSRTAAVDSAPCTSGFPMRPSRSITRGSGSEITASGRSRTDLFPSDSPIRQLFEWEELRAFVAAILGLETIYPYADPLGALNLAVMGEGDELQWHYDQTDFVVLARVAGRRRGRRLRGRALHPRRRRRALRRRRARARGRPRSAHRAAHDPGNIAGVRGRHSMHRVSRPFTVPRLGSSACSGTTPSPER